jgi:hypothetical protein
MVKRLNGLGLLKNLIEVLPNFDSLHTTEYLLQVSGMTVQQGLVEAVDPPMP